MDLDPYPPFARILSPIEISRGCPWGCTYCQTPRLFGSCMRHRSIPIIAKYARRHKDIRFTSPNSLAYGSDGRRPRLEKVEALLKASGGAEEAHLLRHIPLRGPAGVRLPSRPWSSSPDTAPIRASAWAASPAALPCCAASAGATAARRSRRPAIWRWSIGLTPQVDLIFGLPDGVGRGPAHDPGSGADGSWQKAEKCGRIASRPCRERPLRDASPRPLAEEVEACLGSLALEGRLTGSWSAGRMLEIELLEGLSVLVLQLVFYYHLLGHNLNLFYRLGEEIPDESPVRELVSVRQGGGELGRLPGCRCGASRFPRQRGRES